MAQPQRREDRSSAERILAVAETLFGRHGVDGVSLRQIGAAAGSSNNYAVQYHFGDAAGLVKAILTRRMTEVEDLQQALLERLEAEGRSHEVRALLDVFLKPLLQPVDGDGQRVYARFIVALLNSPDGPRHFKDLFHLAPTAVRLQRLLQAALPDAPPLVLSERLRLIAIMVLASVFNRVAPAADPGTDAGLIDDALDVAASGLSAPVGPSLIR
ncbi:TetR/AcrR family transcriptional regulator [Phenylobacterium sp. LjRoot219]|uniref:TetR/AcrR family transcriptional regulator n=1 Tax=Phenylobacterium sp. LjRoot219 TaxID=3342283 RepID=UPI003ECF93EE